ncbi:hypothetical protein BpHYR1_037485 [Brachionus plicatilis]|uniref:Uncharacterized protein n=1 Tax=Brachionus plicatilis TaxID=10195 RepID=A0A3M7Q5G9_BRAPC|nr:hypothetical protein BpHYR1_037485 [Brachionus plicatilis]
MKTFTLKLQENSEINDLDFLGLLIDVEHEFRHKVDLLSAESNFQSERFQITKFFYNKITNKQASFIKELIKKNRITVKTKEIFKPFFYGFDH